MAASASGAAEAQRRALETQLRLIAGAVPSLGLAAAAKLLTREQLGMVAEERDLEGLCGMPTCGGSSRACPNQDPEVLTLVQGHFVQRILYYRFCSDDCFAKFFALPSRSTPSVRWKDQAENNGGTEDLDSDGRNDDDDAAAAAEEEEEEEDEEEEPPTAPLPPKKQQRGTVNLNHVKERVKKGDSAASKPHLLSWNDLLAAGSEELKDDNPEEDDTDLPSFVIVLSLFIEWTTLSPSVSSKEAEPWQLERKARIAMLLEEHSCLRDDALLALRKTLRNFLETINLKGSAFARMRSEDWALASHALVLYFLELNRLPILALRDADSTNSFDPSEVGNLVRFLAAWNTQNGNDEVDVLDFSQVVGFLDVQVVHLRGHGRQRESEFRIKCKWPGLVEATWHPVEAIYSRIPDRVRDFLFHPPSDLPSTAVRVLPFIQRSLGLSEGP